MKLDPGAAQCVGARQQVFGVAVAAHGDDVRMLDEQQLIGNLAALASFDEVCCCKRRALGIAACAPGRATRSARIAVRH